MDAHGNYWYLEHVSSGKKLILQTGENTVGRHSSCKFVLRDYDFLSRQHAKFTINSENIVSLEEVSALNGVYVNELKLQAKKQPLNSGDKIGLGVQVEALDAAVPPNYAIFQLKQMCANHEEIVVISDDDSNDHTPPRIPKVANESIKDAVKQEVTEANNANNAADKCPRNLNVQRPIHLPKLPEVKQELLSQATKDIENIFGEADQELLESVFQINPYVYKQLNNNNIAIAGEKICDGDVIELPEEVNKPKEELPKEANKQKAETSEEADKLEMPPPPIPTSLAEEEVIVDDNEDDYDENFALSQAVLREMKDEMADSPVDLSDGDHENNEEDDFLVPASWIKTEIATQIDDDEIVIIEDEDDELYSKVADWSSKLFSQNVMSQVYPLDEEDNSNDEDIVEGQTLQLFNDIKSDDDDLSDLPVSTKRRSKALRIDSSASEDETSATCTADSTTPQKAKLRRCNVRLKSIDMAQWQLKDCDVSSSTDDLTAIRNSTKSTAEPSKILDQNNQLELEVILVPQLTNISSPKAKKKAATRKRTKTVSERAEPKKLPVKKPECAPVTEPEKPIKKLSPRLLSRSKSCYVEGPLSSSAKSQKTTIANKNKSKELPAEVTPVTEPKPLAKQRSPRLQNRSESCYMESSLPASKKQPNVTVAHRIEVPVPESSTPTKKRSPRLLTRSKSCYFESPMASPKTPTVDKTKELPTKPADIIPATVSDKPSGKPLSARLLNRSKSCYMERPLLERPGDAVSPKSGENSRGPIMIAAPHLPKAGGKLRGVSAISKENTDKNQILERQRSVDYQAQMKAKWYQKPKDRKRECEEIKEKRREQLKKLSDKPKPEKTVVRSDDRKRKQTAVPTLTNSNRGVFLTKDVQPPTKKPKLDKAPAKAAKPAPNRRATIDSFSQQLIAADFIKSPPKHQSRPPARKDAEQARNKRTCNRVTFAEMDREFDLRQQRDKRVKNNRRVRFNDNVQIRIIERIDGACKKVGNIKDTKKIALSTFAERRAWSQAQGRLENFTDLIMGNILCWANQWLKLRSIDVVAESEVLIPIPNEFKSYKEYRDIIIPLMKLELLSTIERDYKFSKSTFEVNLKTVSNSSSRHRSRYVLITRFNQKLIKRFDLYTISSGHKLKETFASVARVQRIAGNVYELCFEILQENICLESLSSCKTLTVRPVVDNIRVEMGAFNAIYLLGRSPLFQRILQPSENVLSYDNKLLQQAAYKGFKRLNDHQLDICKRTWSRLIDDSTPSITLIQGPPGTGKSVVISNLALQCMYGSSNHMLDRKILICAHSNAAVDNITLYLNSARQAMNHSQFELVRFGIFEKMDQNVRDVSLDAYLGKKLIEKRKRLSPENIECLTKQQELLEKEIAELKKIPAQLNYKQQQLDNKERQLRLVIEQLKPPLTPREEHEFTMAFLQRANIVCTTLSSCVKLASYVDYFDACVIDEATQCTEPWTLLPLRFGVRGLVLVGDTQQLPATVLSQKAIDFGLGNSMFDRIQRNLTQQLDKPRGNHFVHTKVFKLSMQYRMHPEICKWPNSYFYDNHLVNADSTHHLISPFIPYCVINLSYTRDTNDTSSRSISNDEEARFVAKLLVEMDKLMPTNRFRYGLITPYSNHCYTLSQVIPSHMKITPHTVDAYQGQERDVIILSNARTRGVGFLTNYQRLNVAITRPKRCLIICGNFDDLQTVQIWRHLLDDAQKREVYFDLQRSDVDDLHKSLISKMLVKPIEIFDDAAPSCKR